MIAVRRGIILLLLIAGWMTNHWLGATTHADQGAIPNRSTSSPETRQRVDRIRRWWGRGPRTAPPNQVGKNHELIRSAFDDAVKLANPSTVRVFSGDDQVAMGVIVDAGGFILTKNSELGEIVSCKIAGHGDLSARVVARNEALDLALLHVNESSLTAATLSESLVPMSLGSWVAVPSGFGPHPIVVGVISGSPRRIERESPALGVLIEDAAKGVTVTRVLPGSGAEAAGIEDGDIITQVNETSIRQQFQLVNEIRRMSPGDKVEVKLTRGDQRVSLTPVLGRAREIAFADQGGSHEGGAVSDRQSGFPMAIQHDCLIKPHQCGGPLVNVDGQILGINIARAGRVTSFALPNEIVVPAVRAMLATAKSE